MDPPVCPQSTGPFHTTSTISTQPHPATFFGGFPWWICRILPSSHLSPNPQIYLQIPGFDQDAYLTQQLWPPDFISPKLYPNCRPNQTCTFFLLPQPALSTSDTELTKEAHISRSLCKIQRKCDYMNYCRLWERISRSQALFIYMIITYNCKDTVIFPLYVGLRNWCFLSKVIQNYNFKESNYLPLLPHFEEEFIVKAKNHDVLILTNSENTYHTCAFF